MRTPANSRTKNNHFFESITTGEVSTAFSHQSYSNGKEERQKRKGIKNCHTTPGKRRQRNETDLLRRRFLLWEESKGEYCTVPVEIVQSAVADKEADQPPINPSAMVRRLAGIVLCSSFVVFLSGSRFETPGTVMAANTQSQTDTNYQNSAVKNSGYQGNYNYNNSNNNYNYNNNNDDANTGNYGNGNGYNDDDGNGNNGDDGAYYYNNGNGNNNTDQYQYAYSQYGANYNNAASFQDDLIELDLGSEGFDGMSIMPVSCVNYNNGHFIKFELFDTAKSYQCHFAQLGSFVVSIAHYMRAVYNYRVLAEGQAFALPDDVGYLNCIPLKLDAYWQYGERFGTTTTDDAAAADDDNGEAEDSEEDDDEANQTQPENILYAKVGCMNKETFSSAKFQLHVYTDNMCTVPYEDGQTSQQHAKNGYAIDFDQYYTVAANEEEGDDNNNGDGDDEKEAMDYDDDSNILQFSTHVSFRPTFLQCQNCKPGAISDTFNKFEGAWYDDAFISQYGYRQSEYEEEEEEEEKGCQSNCQYFSYYDLDDTFADDFNNHYDDDAYVAANGGGQSNGAAADDAYYNAVDDAYMSYNSNNNNNNNNGDDEWSGYNQYYYNMNTDDANNNNNNNNGNNRKHRRRFLGDGNSNQHNTKESARSLVSLSLSTPSTTSTAIAIAPSSSASSPPQRRLVPNEKEFKRFEIEFWNHIESQRDGLSTSTSTSTSSRELYDMYGGVDDWNLCEQVYNYGLYCDEECQALDAFTHTQWSAADIVLVSLMVTFMMMMMILVVAKRLKASRDYKKQRAYYSKNDFDPTSTSMTTHNMPGLPPLVMGIMFAFAMIVIISLAALNFVNETLVFAVVCCILLFIYTLKLTLFQSSQQSPVLLASPNHFEKNDDIFGYGHSDSIFERKNAPFFT